MKFVQAREIPGLDLTLDRESDEGIVGFTVRAKEPDSVAGFFCGMFTRGFPERTDIVFITYRDESDALWNGLVLANSCSFEPAEVFFPVADGDYAKLLHLMKRGSRPEFEKLGAVDFRITFRRELRLA